LNVELARLQWRNGSRRLEAVRGEPALYARLHAEVEVLRSELRRRLGETFTLEELSSAYARADDWVRPVLEDAAPEGAPPSDVPTVADAAFYSYSLGATDYEP
jgi:hypothetical protein